jgi:hypothetical protein
VKPSIVLATAIVFSSIGSAFPQQEQREVVLVCRVTTVCQLFLNAQLRDCPPGFGSSTPYPEEFAISLDLKNGVANHNGKRLNLSITEQSFTIHSKETTSHYESSLSYSINRFTTKITGQTMMILDGQRNAPLRYPIDGSCTPQSRRQF